MEIRPATALPAWVARRERGPHVDRLLLWVPFAVAVALTFANSPDDTFITLRYAYNLLHGHGLVFNPGGEPVNGATSPVGVLMAVVALVVMTTDVVPGGMVWGVHR